MVVLMSVLLGASVDSRLRTQAVQERILRQLRRYFSPHLVDYITAQEGAGQTTGASTRKEVTVLFADLRDFTPLAEAMEPEEVMELLNQYLETMTEEIFREDGTLDKYIGDGLMAFFGDPGWYPDHSERAFRAALRMQGRMRELHSVWTARGWGTPGTGIGICTGHATVGNVGSPARMEYTAVGSTVNAASRLSSIAGSGEILAPRRTYTRVQHLFRGSAREPTMLKGFSQAIDLVEITGARVVTQLSQSGDNHRLSEIVSAVVDDASYRALILSSPLEAGVALHLTPDELARAHDVALMVGYPPFAEVPAREIVALLETASTDQCAEGTILIQQGGHDDRFFVTLEGDVVVTVRGEMGREMHVASLSRGDVFGEISLMHNVPRTATVRSISKGRFLVLPKREFHAFLEQAPVFRGRLELLATARSRDAVGSYVP
jgi:class 3 adenylate cyclase